MLQRRPAFGPSKRARAMLVRLFATVSLLCATATTQELLLLAAGVECCADDADCGQGDCAPVGCQVCPCCHFSAVPTAPAPSATLPALATATAVLPSATWLSLDYREPPFRPPAG